MQILRASGTPHFALSRSSIMTSLRTLIPSVALAAVLAGGAQAATITNFTNALFGDAEEQPLSANMFDPLVEPLDPQVAEKTIWGVSANAVMISAEPDVFETAPYPNLARPVTIALPTLSAPSLHVTVQPAVVPLPAGLPLLAMGLGFLGLARKRRSS